MEPQKKQTKKEETKMTKTIENLNGDRERVTLPNPIPDSSCKNFGTGVSLEAIYRGPRTGRFILHTYSIWENRQTHGVMGDQFYEVDLSAFLHACECAGVDPGVTAADL